MQELVQLLPTSGRRSKDCLARANHLNWTRALWNCRVQQREERCRPCGGGWTRERKASFALTRVSHCGGEKTGVDTKVERRGEVVGAAGGQKGRGVLKAGTSVGAAGDWRGESRVRAGRREKDSSGRVGAKTSGRHLLGVGRTGKRGMMMVRKEMNKW